MSNATPIEWTDATWNPVRGCSRVSEGCRNCYAEKVAARFSGPGLPYEGLAKDGRWTGVVGLVPEHLADPLRWRKPRRIFVNSMSDLFHEALSDESIAAVFGVMAAAPRHTFQVLTKRPERMRRFFEQRDPWSGFKAASVRAGVPSAMFPKPQPESADWTHAPLPNVWLGVSVEDQASADARILHLLDTPAAVRFVSAEPLLGPVDLRALDIVGQFKRGKYIERDKFWPNMRQDAPTGLTTGLDVYSSPALDWVIVGGESGPGARPCDLAWIRRVVDACRAAGVACFVKQLGARASLRLRDRKGGDPSEWPEDLRVREFPKGSQ